MSRHERIGRFKAGSTPIVRHVSTGAAHRLPEDILREAGNRLAIMGLVAADGQRGLCRPREHRRFAVRFVVRPSSLIFAAIVPSTPARPSTLEFASVSIDPFVPRDFTVPARLETDEFRLRMLMVHDVVKDYDAVMSSVDHCRTVWPGGKWPEGLTLEQNLIDLGWHQKEFQTRRSFAYTVVTLSEDRVLGCVYIDPTQKMGYDAVVYLWARQSELAGGLEVRLFGAVKEWIAREWPFRSAGYPGRDIAWEEWRAIPDETR